MIRPNQAPRPFPFTERFPVVATIIQPPRAFQLGIIFVFTEDSRTDAELQAYILRSVSANLEAGSYAKGAAVTPIGGEMLAVLLQQLQQAAGKPPQ